MTKACQRHRWVPVAFVFMPEHVHLVAVPWDGAGGANELLFAIKRPSSFRIRRLLTGKGDCLLQALVVRERPGKLAFRFWQEGPGHDRNIRDDDELDRVIAYVHRNPMKRGLCSAAADWHWSSAHQYATGTTRLGVPKVVPWDPIANLDWTGPDDWFEAGTPERRRY